MQFIKNYNFIHGVVCSVCRLTLCSLFCNLFVFVYLSVLKHLVSSVKQPKLTMLCSFLK